MFRGTIFINNRTQNVRLPAGMHFPKTIKHVNVRAVGNEIILSPAENSWDNFFLGQSQVTDDFMSERADQYQPDREAL
ncbi:type II toxin-antitoxin system VapB family antitoxin [Candidatus Regiella endosymbiont of Tuberolachnus salignus]|uniref:type II toxin-antitoxin system VapB family antitoxin n=1 Tax=Candidatus Regiella endosymbiont of Tuberolachnus salignus TaxID=3077956 RepID=UPI0030D5629A